MLERIRNNIVLKMISLALAIGAWAYLRFGGTMITEHFDQQIDSFLRCRQ